MNNPLDQYLLSAPEPRQIDELINFLKQNWVNTYVGLGNISIEDVQAIDFQSEADLMHQIISDPTIGKYWQVRTKNGQLVGVFSILFSPSSIHNLYISPDYQGQGIGQLAMNTMLNELKDSSSVELAVIGVNQKAVSFYQKFGFRTVNSRLSSRFTKFAHKNVEVLTMLA